jgi:hypothetical protein
VAREPSEPTAVVEDQRSTQMEDGERTIQRARKPEKREGEAIDDV